jgi:hypothetical protein
VRHLSPTTHREDGRQAGEARLLENGLEGCDSNHRAAERVPRARLVVCITARGTDANRRKQYALPMPAGIVASDFP